MNNRAGSEGMNITKWRRKFTKHSKGSIENERTGKEQKNRTNVRGRRKWILLPLDPSNPNHPSSDSPNSSPPPLLRHHLLLPPTRRLSTGCAAASPTRPRRYPISRSFNPTRATRLRLERGRSRCPNLNGWRKRSLEERSILRSRRSWGNWNCILFAKRLSALIWVSVGLVVKLGLLLLPLWFSVILVPGVAGSFSFLFIFLLFTYQHFLIRCWRNSFCVFCSGNISSSIWHALMLALNDLNYY